MSYTKHDTWDVARGGMQPHVHFDTRWQHLSKLVGRLMVGAFGVRCKHQGILGVHQNARSNEASGFEPWLLAHACRYAYMGFELCVRGNPTRSMSGLQARPALLPCS